MSDNRILRSRVAGQSAMSDAVRALATARQRGTLARMIGVSPLTAESRAAYRAALGEFVVGDVLDNLGQRWDVLHDLPLGESVLDHLVIGPAGVFAVRTANCSGEDVTVEGGTLVVAGERRNDIAECRSQAGTVARILSEAVGDPVPVRALLVIVDPRRATVPPAAEVLIVRSREVERVLTRAPGTLDGDRVARISDLADLVATWPPRKDEVLDAQRLHQDFALIRAEVRAAAGRRIMWGAAGFAVAYGLVWGSVASIVAAMVHA